MFKNNLENVFNNYVIIWALVKKNLLFLLRWIEHT